MGLIFFGIKQAPIGIDEILVKCPACEADSFADIMVFSNYYHIYFIPIFPIDKEVNIICQKCGLKSYHVPFTPTTFKNYNEIKSKFRHPWYTYVFIGLIAFITVIAIIVS